MAARQDASTGEMVEDEGAKTKSDPKSDPTMMQVKVYSPYQVYFDDLATSISAINDTGPFDILKGHHRFLTLLVPCELAIAAAKGEEKIKISHGIMYVKEDRVTVFLDV
jgi:F0F1-type ATP synthase epsilon subunit